MNTYQLTKVARRAIRKAYKLRHAPMQKEDAEQKARAWESLAVAADALRALRSQRAGEGDAAPSAPGTSGPRLNTT
jgi:hypothetical protein